MDNGTMVESFKFLNYCQLATSSLVSERFWTLIRTHRHKLALFDIRYVNTNSYVPYQIGYVPNPFIRMFNEELSPEEHDKWIVSNGYSKQIPHEVQIALKESTENDRNIYEFYADVYQNPNRCQDIRTTVFSANVKLKDETWPLFQHFIRLLMDPFIYIRYLILVPKIDVFCLLAVAVNPGHNRLQCQKLVLDFDGDSQKYIIWIKDHVHCDECEICVDKDSNFDEELLDLFLTGAPCTSAIDIHYDLSKVIIDLVPKFMDLRNGNEYQMVESIQGKVEDREGVEELKHNFAEFITEEKYEDDYGTGQIIGFINNDINKKLTLDVRNFSYGSAFFSIKITDL